MQGVEGLAQGLQMAAVRDDGIAVVDASGVESRAESGKEPFDSFAGFAEMKRVSGFADDTLYSIPQPEDTFDSVIRASGLSHLLTMSKRVCSDVICMAGGIGQVASTT